MSLRRIAFLFPCLFLWGSIFVYADDADLDKSIAEHRMGTLIVHATPGASIRVEQMRHEFWFGAALSNGIFRPGNDSSDAQKYKEVFLANFNSAVTENAVKWYSMEPRQGKVDYSIVDSILAWADKNEIPVRGHNIFWGTPQFVQPWLKELSDDALREAIHRRAVDIGKRYKGRFAECDLNNEMIHGNYYEDRLDFEITKQMFDWYRQEDPNTPLFVNDYNILTGRSLDHYVDHIRHLLDAGMPVGGIGVQGHSHGTTFDPAEANRALDALAQFHLPIRVTEFNMPGQNSPYAENRQLKLTEEQEKQKAEEIVKFYRTCFAHPAVDGILMWGFWEGANWIPASSLYHRDWSPTPAANAYRDLVFNQWWTKFSGQANQEGVCEIPAFFGRHRITVDGKEQIVELKKKDKKVTVAF